jgi:hypothetical protein
MRIPAYPSRRVLAHAAGAALFVAALTLGACSSKAGTNGSGELGNLPGTPTTAPSVAPSASGGGTASTPPPSSTATPSHSSNGGGSGVTLTLAITQQPACPVTGDTSAPFQANGEDIIIHWTVSGGATGVAVSLDDPKFFAQYHTGSLQNFTGTSGDAEMPFTCDITVQPNTTHEYTFDTLGGGKSVEKSITSTKQTSP